MGALLAASVDVTYRCFDPLPHGFVSFTGAVPAAEDAVRHIARLMRERSPGIRRCAASLASKKRPLFQWPCGQRTAGIFVPCGGAFFGR